MTVRRLLTHFESTKKIIHMQRNAARYNLSLKETFYNFLPYLYYNFAFLNQDLWKPGILNPCLLLSQLLFLHCFLPKKE